MFPTVGACCGPIQIPTVFGPPTLAGYTNFLLNYVGVPLAALQTPGCTGPTKKPNAYSITISYALALDIVSRQLCAAGIDIFTFCIYNCAADRLIQFSPDNPAAPPPANTYFADLRLSFGINQFRAGVVQSAHDVSTGTTLVVPDWAKNLTLLDLQAMNTPYGQAYLGIAQQIGSLWGLS